MRSGARPPILSSASILLGDFARMAGKRGALAVLCVFAGAILEGIGISLLVPLLGLLFNGGGGPRWVGAAAAAAFAFFGAHGRLSSLLVLLGIFALLIALRAIVISTRDLLILRLQLQFVESQQLRIAAALAGAPWEFLASLRHARVTQLAGSDMHRLGVGIHFVIRGTVSLVILLVQCALAFVLAPILAAFVVVLLVLGAIGLRPMLAKSRSLGDYVADANLALLDTTTQFMGGLKLAISQGLQERFVVEMRETLQNLSARQVKFGRRQILTQSGLSMTLGLVGAAAVFAGLFWLHVAPSLLIALLLVVARMATPVLQIQQAADQFVHLLPVYTKAHELRRELTRARDETNIRTGASIPDGSIVFENVTSAPVDLRGPLPGIEPAGILRNFNIAIRRGEFLGVTGDSGAGKTTFADLLAGLYPPQAGRIAVGGQVLSADILAAWRSGLAYVPQDPFLFHDTIRRNLAWANPLAGESDMWRALVFTDADTLVCRMEDGLDSFVAERGTRLSGGERQRIALSRALLRRPSVLILDESTSALDGASERQILLQLRNLVPRPTIVLIAHRTDNLAVCDRVVRLETIGGVTVASQVNTSISSQHENVVSFRPVVSGLT